MESVVVKSSDSSTQVTEKPKYAPIEEIPKSWGSCSVYFKATPKKPFPDFPWLKGFFSYLEEQYPNGGDFGEALLLFRCELQGIKEPLAIKINHFEPNQGTSRQYHFNRRELYLGLKGNVEVSKGPVPYGERGWDQLSKATLKPGYTETIGEKVVHETENTTDKISEVLEVLVGDSREENYC